MRRSVFFTFLLLFLYSSLMAQSEKKKGGLAVTLSGALIPISQPGLGIQPGVEYRFNDHFSLLAEIAFRANKKNSKDSSELNKQYIRYKTEIRYRLPGKRKKNQQYVGLQLSRASRQFINQNSFYFDNKGTDSGYYYSKAFIHSPVATISLQVGSIISFSKEKFAVDLFAGIGARFIHTAITDIENPVRSIIRKPDSGLSFTASYSYAGNITMFHLNGGIRFMWRFNQFHETKK